jgi:hypothetical protein
LISVTWLSGKSEAPNPSFKEKTHLLTVRTAERRIADL